MLIKELFLNLDVKYIKKNKTKDPTIRVLVGHE